MCHRGSFPVITDNVKYAGCSVKKKNNSGCAQESLVPHSLSVDCKQQTTKESEREKRKENNFPSYSLTFDS